LTQYFVTTIGFSQFIVNKIEDNFIFKGKKEVVLEGTFTKKIKKPLLKTVRV